MSSHIVFDQHIGFLVWDTERRIAREFAARAARHGVNAGLVPFLRVLELQDGITQQQLAASVTMRSSTTAAAIQDLERQDLVRKVPSETDRRKTIVHLTELGRELVKGISKEADQINELLRRRFSNVEAKQLKSLLQRLRDNLQ